MIQKKKEYIYIVIIILSAIAAFFVRWRGIEYITADLEACVLPWSEAMKTGQGLRILSSYDGDYNMPYITILWLLNYLPGRTIIKVKMFSILFDYLAAIAAGLIMAHFARTGKKLFGFMVACIAILFYPSIVLNGAYWGQCDSVYVAFLLYMIWALLKRRYNMAMFFWGCALSFKLQAVLILPVLLIFWWKRKDFAGTVFFLVPMTMEILCIPAILGGYSVFAPFLVYMRQLGRYPNMYVFYPNFWALFRNARYYIFSSVAIIFVLTGLGIFSLAVIRKKEKITEKQWIEYAVWSTFFMMCFLPCMHERYGMLVEILAIIYAFLERKTWWNAVIIGTGSYIAYLQTTFGYSFLPDQWIAVAYLISLGFFSLAMVKGWNKGEIVEACQESLEKQKKGISVVGDRIIETISHYALLIGVVVFTILAVAIRKPMIEYMSPDYLSNLIEVEGNYHTPLYMLAIFTISKFAAVFLEGKTLFFLVKMSCLVSDIFAAGMVALCFYDLGTGKNTKNLEENKKELKNDLMLRTVLLYVSMLFFPAVLCNSMLWGHLDSISVGLLAGAYLLYIREKEAMAGVLAGVACGLFTYYVVWLLIAILIIVTTAGQRNDRRKRLRYLIYSFAAVLLLSSFSGILCTYDIWQSISKFLTAWKNAGDWMIYPMLVLVLFACFYNEDWIPVWLFLEVAVILDWGKFLYNQPILPDAVYVTLYLLADVWAAIILWKNWRKVKIEYEY